MSTSAETLTLEPEIERSTEASSGLCITCRHALACAFRRDPESPVLFCEEFDCGSVDPSTSPPGVTARNADVPPWTGEDTVLAASYPGLCSNCEKRSSCAFPKAQGGVWHCEEYE